MSKQKKQTPLVTPPVPPDAKIESTVPEANRELTISTPDAGQPHKEPARGQETATFPQGGAETATATRATEAPKGKPVKVKILRTSPLHAHWPGQEAEYPKETADQLIAGGFAEKA